MIKKSDSYQGGKNGQICETTVRFSVFSGGGSLAIGGRISAGNSACLT